MSSHIQKSNQASGPTTLEILVVRVAGEWLAVRSARLMRLVSFEARQLQADEPGQTNFPGRLGLLQKANEAVPVYDLAYLLGLRNAPQTPESGQLVQASPEGQPACFTIEEAQEIQRVPVAELRRLPEIISRSQTNPAIWAVWARPGGELIPLLDLTFALKADLSPRIPEL